MGLLPAWFSTLRYAIIEFYALQLHCIIIKSVLTNAILLAGADICIYIYLHSFKANQIYVHELVLGSSDGVEVHVPVIGL